MREPSSTYILATRPGFLTASSERTGETNSPVATIVPPDSEEAMAGPDALPRVAPAASPAGLLAVAAAATFCTSLGSAGAACVVVAVATSFFAQPDGSSAKVTIEIVVMNERVIAGLLPLQQLL
jgi:hypothetical protein